VVAPTQADFKMSRLTDLWRRFRQAGALARESILIGLCLLTGLLLIPAAIYLVGVRLFGSYEHGSYLRFVGDIASGAFGGSWPFLMLIAGPYAGLWALRLWRRAMRQGQ
jgi:hypothetical protein